MGSSVQPTVLGCCCCCSRSPVPYEAAAGRRISPQGRAQEVREFLAGTWMYRRETPQARREPLRSEGASSGSPFFWLLFFGEAKKSDSAAEGSRNGREPCTRQRIPSSHPKRSRRIETRDARMNPRGRAFRRSYKERLTAKAQPPDEDPNRAFSNPQLARKLCASPPAGLPGRSASFHEYTSICAQAWPSGMKRSR
jgi:hypothetical protein